MAYFFRPLCGFIERLDTPYIPRSSSPLLLRRPVVDIQGPGYIHEWAMPEVRRSVCSGFSHGLQLECNTGNYIGIRQ